MGNCQAIEAAALVIQHPCGRIERHYWPINASEVMRLNPGHYVSLILPLPVFSEENAVRLTRVQLLRSTDTLVLGHAYRLITSQEVMKVLRAKKIAKLKQKDDDSVEELQPRPEKDTSGCQAEVKSEMDKSRQGMRHEKHRRRIASTGSILTRSKSWQPSLQSISEAGS